MGTTFLTGRRYTPAFHEVAHDLLSRLRLIGGKQRFGWPFARRIAGEDPPHRQRRRANPIPPGGAGPPFQGPLPFPFPFPFPFPLPGQGEALPDRVRVIQDVFQRGQPRADDARAAASVWGLRTGVG
jgi:hypothetical protein